MPAEQHDDGLAPLWAPGQLAVDVPTAATALGLNVEQVRRLLRGRELRGRKVGKSWIVPVASLHEFVGGTYHASAAA
ncbi:MAG: hypothetical protein EA388_15575 [Nitriliruptor sp.]|nr:MAG: hypothetical protein EA388_15575 [Nitriliruptor sp.]